jgi:hypothetical protein
MQNREARTDMAREEYFWSGFRGAACGRLPMLGSARVDL